MELAWRDLNLLHSVGIPCNFPLFLVIVGGICGISDVGKFIYIDIDIDIDIGIVYDVDIV